jgi:hypothetical protein
MNIAAQHVGPEDVMAFLDGELTAAQGEAVSAHLDECEACAGIAAQFRDMSQWVSRWEVPAVSPKLEQSIKQEAARRGMKRGGTSEFRPGRSRWKPWAFGTGGVLAAASLVLLVVSRPVFQSHPIAKDQATIINGPTVDPALPSPPMAQQSMPSGITAPEPSPAPPLIARSASLVVLVKDFAASRSSLESKLAQHGGYFAQMDVATGEDAPRTLQGSLRVPVAELGPAIEDLKTLGRVQSESQSGEDVTQQHADLVERLKTARETEERFRAILERRGGDIADVLAVEEGIARVRGEIESMEAEQKALVHRVDFATVDLQMTEEYKARLDSGEDAASMRMHNALIAGYHNASASVVGIILFFEEYGPALLIWLVVLGLPAVAMCLRYRRLRSRF